MDFYHKKFLAKKDRVTSAIVWRIHIFVYVYLVMVLFYSNIAGKALSDWNGVWWRCLKLWITLIPLFAVITKQSIEKYLEKVSFDENGLTYYKSFSSTGERIEYGEINLVIISMRKMGVPGRELRSCIYIDAENGKGLTMNLSYNLAKALYKHRKNYEMQFTRVYPQSRTELKECFRLKGNEFLTEDEELFLLKQYCKGKIGGDGSKMLQKYRKRRK